jgi:HEAT repeat protein
LSVENGWRLQGERAIKASIRIKAGRLLWVSIAFAAVLAAVLVFLNYSSREHFFRGRSTSYWKRLVKEYHENPHWSPSLMEKGLNYVFAKGAPTDRPLVLDDGPAALPVLLELVNDEDQDVRNAALIALGELSEYRSEEIVPVLLDALNDSHPKTRALAALSLYYACSETEIVVPRLIGMLSDRDEHVRGDAGESLVQMGLRCPRAVPQLIQGLKNPSASVRTELVDVLIQVAINSEGEEAEPIVLAVGSLLSDENEKVRLAGLKALPIMGGEPRACVTPILQAMVMQDSRFRERCLDVLQDMGVRAVPVLIETLCGGDRRLKVMAARALGRIGPPAAPAIRFLKQSLRDESPEMRKVGAESLNKIIVPVCFPVAAPW